MNENVRIFLIFQDRGASGTLLGQLGPAHFCLVFSHCALLPLNSSLLFQPSEKNQVTAEFQQEVLETPTCSQRSQGWESLPSTWATEDFLLIPEFLSLSLNLQAVPLTHQGNPEWSSSNCLASRGQKEARQLQAGEWICFLSPGPPLPHCCPSYCLPHWTRIITIGHHGAEHRASLTKVLPGRGPVVSLVHSEFC